MARLVPPPATTSAEELGLRIDALLGYRGHDPQVLARQQRLVQLLETARQRKADCEGRQA